ncbi:MAG: rubredoxin [Armatimonadota bacterium]
MTDLLSLPKYECALCGYVYDPVLGDPDNDIPAGTPFHEVPAEWVCPDCGAEKDAFQPMPE